MTKPDLPPAPRGSGATARKLWRSVLAEYELQEHELALLARACRVADTCEQLQSVVDEEGALVETRLGEKRAHPALVELRQQSLTLARLLVALRVPLGDEESGGGARTQRRGLRGVYGVRSAS